MRAAVIWVNSDSWIGYTVQDAQWCLSPEERPLWCTILLVYIVWAVCKRKKSRHAIRKYTPPAPMGTSTLRWSRYTIDRFAPQWIGSAVHVGKAQPISCALFCVAVVWRNKTETGISISYISCGFGRWLETRKVIDSRRKLGWCTKFKNRAINYWFVISPFSQEGGRVQGWESVWYVEGDRGFPYLKKCIGFRNMFQQASCKHICCQNNSQ